MADEFVTAAERVLEAVYEEGVGDEGGRGSPLWAMFMMGLIDRLRPGDTASDVLRAYYGPRLAEMEAVAWPNGGEVT